LVRFDGGHFNSWRGVHMKQAEWYARYTAAVSESNPAKLPMRIHEAESAMFLRIQDLAEHPESDHERDILTNALSSLHALQRNLLRSSRQVA
jgi:hypothetical protein